MSSIDDSSSDTEKFDRIKIGPEYLAQLLKDKQQLQQFRGTFNHVERVLEDEIQKVRQTIIHSNSKLDPIILPDPDGAVVILSEKLYVPVKEFPDFNFIGRILGPRGLTAKQLEQDTGCKIMVRGRGSTRDKKREEQYKSKSSWEHLSEDLHVLITAEDYEERARVKLKHAIEQVKKLLVPSVEGEDELKKSQLMELAIMNGTFRDYSKPSSANSSPGIALPTSTPPLLIPASQMTHIGAPPPPPLILTSRLPLGPNSQLPCSPTTHVISGNPLTPILSPPSENSGLYCQCDQYVVTSTLPSPLTPATPFNFIDYTFHQAQQFGNNFNFPPPMQLPLVR